MSKFFEKVIRPTLFKLDAERAHELGVKALELGLANGRKLNDEQRLFVKEAFGPVRRFGLEFTNPLGIAAGFDKNAIVVDRLASLGFGFVEVGTVTFQPQSGNPKPRIFRLPADKALINRLGFNNEGAAGIAERLTKSKKKNVVGVNIGRNKEVKNEDAIENYLKTFEIIYPVADYIAVNISSPNTPNLRQLQSSENLESLLSELQRRNLELDAKPLLVKVSPDLETVEIESIVDVCLKARVSGIIATNTTVSRQGLDTADPERFREGGLSGRPLAERSNRVIEEIYKNSKGKLLIVGVGGIFTAEDAFEKMSKGASLVQAYTGFIYSGPWFPVDVVYGLARIIKAKGFSHLDEVIGSAVR